MDDFELDVNSTGFIKDDFYESFEAPKYYDFVNPQDPEDADQWFLNRPGLRIIPRHLNTGLKEEIPKCTTEVQCASTTTVLKKPPKGSGRLLLLKVKEKTKSNSDSTIQQQDSTDSKFKHLSENENPNQSSKVTKLKLTTSTSVKATLVEDETRILAQRLERVELTTDFNGQQDTVKKQEMLPQKSSSSPAQSQQQEKAAAAAAAATTPDRKKGNAERSSLSRTTASKSLNFDAIHPNAVVRPPLALTELTAPPKETESHETNKSSASAAQSVIVAAKISKAKRKDITHFHPVIQIKLPQAKQQGKKRKSSEMNTRPKEETKVAPVGASKKPKTTCPHPFRLLTEERGALKEIEFNKKAEEYLAMKEGLTFPPFNTSSSTAKVRINKPVVRRSNKAQKQHLQPKSSTCANVNDEVDISVEMAKKAFQIQPQKQEMNSSSSLVSEQGNMRKQQSVCRAQVMPSFDRPFKPQRSTKKLTIPKEPKFHIINGRRTCCTKHSEQAL